MPRAPEEKTPQRDLPALFSTCEPLVSSLFAQSGAANWLSRSQFANGLERSVRKRFPDGPPARGRLEEYLLTLHAEDLALATACLEGCEAAWEHFVVEYRSYLRGAAGAITKASRFGANPQELADSLFSDLFGPVDGKRGALFRYFHGRSSLKTWLRTVLAQRHVDHIRAQRRLESLDSEDGEKRALPPERVEQPLLDPYRSHYQSCFAAALEHALGSLQAGDRQRLELYYVRNMTLAEIGRELGEHESSVSRSLEKIRQELRAQSEKCLRESFSLSDAEIEQCYTYATQEALIDFRKLFPETKSGTPPAKGKES